MREAVASVVICYILMRPNKGPPHPHKNDDHGDDDEGEATARDGSFAQGQVGLANGLEPRVRISRRILGSRIGSVLHHILRMECSVTSRSETCKNINYGHHLMDQSVPNPTKSLQSYAGRRSQVRAASSLQDADLRRHRNAALHLADCVHVIPIRAMSACSPCRTLRNVRFCAAVGG